MAYDAGEAFIQIVPSFRGVVAQIEAEAAKWGLSAGQRFSSSFNDAVARGTRGAQLGPGDADVAKQGDARAAKFADAFKARITAALRNLPDITVDANTSDADAKIAELRQRLTELRDAKIGVDIDEATAIAAIDDIKAQLAQLSTESSSIEVRANTGAAMVELDRLRAQLDEIARDTPDVDVRANTGEADAKLAGTKAAADDLARSSPSIKVDVDAGPALAALAAIKTALLGLSAGAVIAPLVGGLAAMLGPLAAVGAGFAGIAAVGIPALSAVTKAQQAQTAATRAAGQSSSQSGAQQAAAANQVKQAELSLDDTERRIANDRITSAEQVKNAQQSLANAQRQAANDVVTSEQKVQQAEQNVTTAQKAATDAQNALTNAREAATRSLQDSQFSVADAQLALQADQLAVAAAQDNLNQVNANATSTDLQKQQAALQLAQAQQALVEQQVTLQRATEDNTAAQAAGVDGSKQVISAQQQITSTTQGVVTATAALAAAKKAAADQATADAQRVASAEQSLADAKRAQAQQEAQDASSLIRATDAVAQAQLAQSSASNASSGASAKAAAALAALTPAERTLYDALQNLKGQFKDFNKAVDPAVVPVFTGAMKILGDLMKPLEPLVIAVAKAFTAVETSLDKAVKSPAFKQFIGTLTSLAGPSVKSIAAILGNLGLVIGHLITAFAPLAPIVLGGLQSLTGGLANATKSPALAGFVKTMVDLAPTLISAFHSVGSLIGQLFTTLAPLAQPVFALIKTLADALIGALVKSGPDLTRLFTGLGKILGDLITALEPVLPVLVKVLANIVEFVAKLSPNQLLAIVGAIGAIVALLGGPFAAAIVAVVAGAVLIIDNWSKIQPAIQPVLNVFSDIWGFITQKLVPVLKGIFVNALDGIKSAFETVSHAIEAHKAQLTQLVNAFKDVVGFIVRDVLPILGPIFKFYFEAAGQVIRVIIDVIAGLIETFNWLVDAGKAVGAFFAGPFVDFFTSAWKAIQDAWQAVVDFFTAAWNDFLKFVTGVWNAITSAISTAWDTVINALKTVWTDVSNWFSGIWASFTQTVTNAWNAITSPIRIAWNAVTNGIKTAWNDVSSFLSKVWDAFVGIVSSAWHAITAPISAAWSGLWSDLKAGWNEIAKFFSGVWKDFAGAAGKAWDAIASGIKTAFGAITGFVKSIWHDVEDVFVRAVNWVVDHILNPIIHLLNTVLGVFGVKIGDVHDIPTSVQSANATGGVLPGYSPGTDNIALPVHLFSGGEGILVPEATRALGGAAGINAINSHYSNRVGQKFSVGGVLPRTPYEQTLLDAQANADLGGSGGDLGPVLTVDDGGLGGLAGDITGAASDVIAAIRAGLADATIAALKAAEAPIRGILSLAPGNLASKMANGFFDKINSEVDDFIRGHVSANAPTTTIDPSISDEHRIFIETALAQSSHTPNPFDVSDVNIIVSHESGWNPNAINLTDSNAAAGHPSQGLMQTIPSTFEEHRLPWLPDNIVDPLANLAAGIRYAFGRYGSLGNVPGVKAVVSGQPYVGYDNGGYLPPGLSSVYNASGRPEPVFNAGQWDSIKAAIANRLSDSHLEQIARNTAHLETYAPATAAGLSAIDGLHTVMVGASS